MSERDVRAIIGWFTDWVARLECAVHYKEIREDVNRLRGFVEVLEGELGKNTH
jgi:hypothetical protein